MQTKKYIQIFLQCQETLILTEKIIFGLILIYMFVY